MDVELHDPVTAVGAARGVLEASATAASANDGSTLAVVVATEGSTYVRAGAMALFGASGKQAGWLSGGCLEPRIAEQAQRSGVMAKVGRMEVDTRDDAALLTGSALGCRGRLVICLLPLAALAGWPDVVATWRVARQPLQLDYPGGGRLRARVGTRRWDWPVELAGETRGREEAWTVSVPPAPTALVLGAGPETPVLVPLLRQLGWLVTVVERRRRWIAAASLADTHVASTPSQAVSGSGVFEAALVMHHDFELDREALETLAATAIPFVGLLGPRRRRDDLFSVLAPQVREALQPRLRSPVGLDLGGQGPEAIALSIAAQLTSLRAGR
jgi:xanthine dehydrogenase accessory factor